MKDNQKGFSFLARQSEQFGAIGHSRSSAKIFQNNLSVRVGSDDGTRDEESPALRRAN
jgi:hypothetical protein